MSSIHQILEQVWGYTEFRQPQESIITEVMEGRDVLALMPTGGGKSLCYQVPGLAKEVLTIVVTPLIALMKDQVYQLRERNIIAYSIHSGMSKRQVDMVLDNCIFGDVKFLYVSPERLQTELFLTRLEKMNVGLIAVDEAHCITQWGYDFRPSYLNIKELRERKPNVPVIALTASATKDAVADIQTQLEFKEPNEIRKSFYRENLNYFVLQEEDKRGRLIQMIQKQQSGSIIVYTRNRRATREICQLLIAEGISASYYHAGLKAKTKDERQELWIQGKFRVMVCTNAFGMGIDKPNVRLVVHFQMPDSLEAYYQEAGRAGRDGENANCVLMYNQRDIDGLNKSLTIRFPDVNEVKRAYQILMNYYQAGIGANYELGTDFEINKICAKYDLNVNQTYYALKSLEQEGYITFSDAVYAPSKVKMEIDSGQLYAFEVANRKFDPILKTLLRSYGGIFEDFVVINESLLAKRAEIEEDQVIELLKRLNNMNILSYQKASDQPKIWFMRGRGNVGQLQLNDATMKERKKQATAKLEAMIEFVTSESTCRNEVLLRYFGEENVEACGHCDNCRNIGQAKPKELQQVIIDFVKSRSKVTVKEIVEACMQDFQQEQVVQLVRKMIDEGQFKLDGEQVWGKE